MGCGVVFFPERFILYLGVALFNLTEAIEHGRSNVRLKIFRKGNAFFLKCLALTSSKLLFKQLMYGFHLEGKVCEKQAKLQCEHGTAEFNVSAGGDF